MSKNLLQRIITSSILIFLLLFIIFSHQYIFILSILILGFIICIEANKMISKILSSKYSEKFNLNFLILNLLTFCYVFFVFCIFSYEIYSSGSSVLFFYVISICFFTDIGGYAFGKIIGGRKLSKISPNKTVSGTIGSFISSMIPLIFFLQFNYLNLEL